MIGKPKPTKQDRPKKKGHVHGICPQCATIFHSTKPEHVQDCPQELPVIMVRKNQTERQLIELALDSLCRQITIWRDGCNCVLAESDGHNCYGGSQWGHVIPQGANTYLVNNLSNSFRQCEGHNGIHRFVQIAYHLWYQSEFGKLALEMLKNAKDEHPTHKFSIMDLYEMQAELSNLYTIRFTFASVTKAEKIELGYYGSIIKEAWIKEGRI